MGIEDLIDFENVLKKTSPYLPVFIYGYALSFGISPIYIFLFISSLVLTTYDFVFREKSQVKLITHLFFKDSNDKEKLKELGETNLKSYYFGGFMAILLVINKVGSLIISIIFTISQRSLVWGVFLILSAIPIIYVIINFVLILKNSVLLIQKVKAQSNSKS